MSKTAFFVEVDQGHKGSNVNFVLFRLPVPNATDFGGAAQQKRPYENKRQQDDGKDQEGRCHCLIWSVTASFHSAKSVSGKDSTILCRQGRRK